MIYVLLFSSIVVLNSALIATLNCSTLTSHWLHTHKVLSSQFNFENILFSNLRNKRPNLRNIFVLFNYARCEKLIEWIVHSTFPLIIQDDNRIISTFYLTNNCRSLRSTIKQSKILNVKCSVFFCLLTHVGKLYSTFNTDKKCSTRNKWH